MIMVYGYKMFKLNAMMLLDVAALTCQISMMLHDSQTLLEYSDGNWLKSWLIMTVLFGRRDELVIT